MSNTRSLLLMAPVLAATALGALSARAEDEPSAPADAAITLRIAPEVGKTLRFRRTLTLRCKTTVGEGALPTTDYDVVQELAVTTTSSEPGKHVFSVECARVVVKGSMQGDEGTETGSWSSDEGADLQMGEDDSILCAASAMGIGRVLAGMTNELTVDDRAEKIGISLSRATRALEKETGRSSSLAPSLHEGVAWRPFFLTGRLPEASVAKGATFTRDVSWAAAMPKRAVHGPVEMRVTSADANEVVIECDAVPKLHAMPRIGVIGKARPDTEFQNGRVTAKLILDATDGLPIDTTWTIAGTYIHHVPFWGDDDMHEQVELTVRVERID